MPNLVATSVILVFVALSSACEKAPAQLDYSAEQSAYFPEAAVASAHPLASDVGKQILERGGNAVDAAVAVQLALAVVYPRAGNIGGGGFLVYRAADGTTDALDYREKAPAAASRDMYLDENKDPVDGLSTRGHLACGVPGTVAGLVAAHEKYGALPWKDLVQPAIDLAKNGFLLSETEASRLNRFQEDFKEFNDEICPFVRTDTTGWQTADRIAQQDLAATLRRIREKKSAGFYAGKTAELFVAEMEANGGLITAADLAAYEPVWRQPITFDYHDYRLISMPPSSSGGIALAQMLGMVENYPLAEYGYHSTAAIHLMAEAERRAYADRAEYLGDMDYYPVPVDSLIAEPYLLQRMETFRPDSASVSTAVGAGDYNMQKESFETTHTSIVDAAGNAVSLTTTLNSNFGNKVMVDGAGFFLNNEMDDFSIKPGTPNQFGLVGKEANAIAPGKRMLSSMTPTIIEKDGQLYMVLGAPGGSTIITAVFQVFVNVAEFGMPLDSAVWAPRFHHQWLPDMIWAEPNVMTDSIRAELAGMGHQFRDVKRMAVIKAIVRTADGQLHAVGDKRNPDDDVSGY
ncbi:MAG: gamma-glutamyltransferase [Bacteroidota bacterium]